MKKIISSLVFVLMVLSIGSSVSIVDSESEWGFSYNTKIEEPFIYEIPLLTIDFENMPHTTSFNELKNTIYGEEGESSNRFWDLTTDGKVKISTGDYEGLKWARAPKPIEYYSTKGDDFVDNNVRELVAWGYEQAIKDGMDYSSYWNKHKYYPFLCVIVSGVNEHTHNTPIDNGFWPHCWAFRGVVDGEETWIRYILMDDDPNGNTLLSMVTAHEIGHNLRLGDLYDTGCSFSNDGPKGCGYPITYYDIMASRHRGQGLCGYHRIYLGLVDPLIIYDSQEVIIPPINDNEFGSVVLTPIENTLEYLLIEYRRRIDEDSFWGGIPKEGVTIYRVDESFPFWWGINARKLSDNYGIEMLNPGGNLWHDDACYTSTGYNIASPYTNPSTLPHSANYTNLVTITVLGEDESGARVKIDIEPRKPINVKSAKSAIKAGHLHKSNHDFTIENISTETLKISNEYMNPPEIELLPGQTSGVKIGLFVPRDQWNREKADRELFFHVNDFSYFHDIELTNILHEIDVNGDRKIDTSDISIISSSDYDERFDVNLDGKLDSNDIAVISKYLGIEY
ncbi:MAG TPA: hypothetical protein PKV16_07320 [Caldisericia bacterium]|nr:hypothetical protein [Caldisericia bacterium]HPF49405.1 hypothetical protein [Caldisericia bacterium]HPI84392.1 hypothetical protein [Caldisericia bacterium]HPQ93576.1 hypothetical protein [Caldisericia bacterium]HRV75545.1 hypothetical protein [Caldisericia bacterium]